MKQTVLRMIAVALIVGSVWGCSAPILPEQASLQETLVRGAMRDREAAYEQLAKAMTDYCRAKHATLEARFACMLDRRLEWLHLRQSHQEEREGRSFTRSSHAYNNGDGSMFPRIKCEHAGTHLICTDQRSALAELRDKRPGTP